MPVWLWKNTRINFSEKKNKEFYYIFACIGKKKQKLLSYLRFNKNVLITNYFSNRETSGNVKITKLDGQQEEIGEYAFGRGEYYKILPEGNYRFEVKTNSKSRTFEIRVDFSMLKENGNYRQLND